MILNSEYKILKQFIFMKLSTQMIYFASTPVRVTAIYEPVLN